MKTKIFTIALLLGLSLSVARAMPSELSIRMFDYSAFNIVIDGQEFSTASTNYTIPGIVSGSHFVKIYKFRPNSGNNGFPKLFFSSVIFIPDGAVISSMIDFSGSYVVLSEKPVIISPYPGNGGHGGHGGHGNGHGHGHGGGSGSGYGNSYDDFKGMSPADFADLKYLVNKTPFDDTRVTIAEQAIAGSYTGIRSKQVGDLMEMLTFESSRLELAKFAYGYVVDKEKFFVVNNAFVFSSSIDELNDFIRGH